LSLRVGALASGRGSNVAALIEACASGDVPAEVVLVLSDAADAPVLEIARSAGVPAEHVAPGSRRAVLSVEAEEEYIRKLQGAGVELLVLAGFMRIIRRPLLRAFRNRILNIHPSLLPSFPGLEAQRQAFDYGAKVAGATVHFVDEGVDTGPIVTQEAVRVEETDTAETLAQRILSIEHRILPRAVRLFAEDRLQIEGRRVRVRRLPGT
jgi:phosphoribosylglycinamide formyltransferase-1